MPTAPAPASRTRSARRALPPRTAALAALTELVPSLFFKLKALTDALHADDALRTADRGILRDLVERGAMTAPALAALRPVSRQAIQPVLDRLVERGLASTAPNPRHARSPVYVATGAGRRAMRTARRREAEALADAADAFALRDLQGAVATLRRLEALLASALRG